MYDGGFISLHVELMGSAAPTALTSRRLAKADKLNRGDIRVSLSRACESFATNCSETVSGFAERRHLRVIGWRLPPAEFRRVLPRQRRRLYRIVRRPPGMGR